MRTTLYYLMLSILLSFSIGLPGQLQAQEDDAKVRKDLKTVLALKGKSCDEIANIRNQGENDYLVTCNNGKRYRIRIDANERVIVEDLN